MQTQSKNFFHLSLGFLGLVGLSFFRFWLAGTLKVDEVEFPIEVNACLRLAWLTASIWIFFYYLECLKEASTLSLRRTAGFVILIHCLTALSLPLTSNDLFSNLAYGTQIHQSINPFFYGPHVLEKTDPYRALVGVHWIYTPMVYGPFNGLINWAATTTGIPWISMITYKCFLLGLSLSIVVMVYYLCKHWVSPSEQTKRFLWFAANPVFIWEISGQAHNDAVMVLCLVLFLWTVFARKLGLDFLFLGLGFFAKYALCPLIGLYALLKGRTQILKTSLFILVAATLSFALVLLTPFGRHWHYGVSDALSDHPKFITNSITYLLYYGIFDWNQKTPPLAYLIYRGFLGGVLVYLALWVLRFRRSFQEVLTGSLIFLTFYFLVGSPGFQPWYLTWLFPLALFVSDDRWRNFLQVYSLLGFVQYAFQSETLFALGQTALLIYFIKTIFKALPK